MSGYRTFLQSGRASTLARVTTKNQWSETPRLSQGLLLPHGVCCCTALGLSKAAGSRAVSTWNALTLASCVKRAC